MSATTNFELAAIQEKSVNPLDLVTIDPEAYVAQVFQPFHLKLAEFKTEIDHIHFDIKTTEGMSVAIKWRAHFRDEVRLAAKNALANRKEPLTKISKLLTASFADIEKAVAPFEDRFHQQITNEVARREGIKQEKIAFETKRRKLIDDEISRIRSLPSSLIGSSSDAIRSAAQELRNLPILEEEFQESLSIANIAAAEALNRLEQLLTMALGKEAAEAARAKELKEQQERNEAERVELEEMRRQLQLEKQKHVVSASGSKPQSPAAHQLDSLADLACVIADAELEEQKAVSVAPLNATPNISSNTSVTRPSAAQIVAVVAIGLDITDEYALQLIKTTDFSKLGM